MINIKYIKAFVFDHAQYEISDKKGDQIILKIDYKHNTYSLRGAGLVVNKSFRAEVHRIAKDLLRRKHGINFAIKLKI